MIGVHSFLQTNTVIQDGLLISQNDGFGDPISWLFVLTGFPAIWLFSKKRLGEVGAKKDSLMNKSLWRYTFTGRSSV